QVVPTSAEEMSLYVNERRYVLRTDGFVAVTATGRGELRTKAFTFGGSELMLNYATSAAGVVQVELADAEGRPLPGYRLRDCRPLVGDHIERAVTWKGGGDLTALAGRPVRLRLVLEDADLYSLRFQTRG
ncbi:MAG: hypothetical protein ABIL09_25205, partial [Gemmatimonadota bacterium]